MARARLLKPGFFSNEGLAELPAHARLLFAGLWCLADREGRLEDRPKRIKAELFPYEEVDVDGLLGELAGAGFVTRYGRGGAAYVQVGSFEKHQRPHYKEPVSIIPPCSTQPRPNHDSTMAVVRVDHESITEPDSAAVGSIISADAEAMTIDDCPVIEPTMDQSSANQSGSWLPLTLNQIQIQKPIPDPVAVAVAVADPGPPPEDPLPPLLRDWERSTGTLVTPTLADWLDGELGAGTPAEWLSDAIAETGANGIKAWKYTRAIIERWRVQGREEQSSGSTDRRGRTARQSPGRRPEETCRVSGRPHDWSKLDGWCAVCTVQEPITEESLRRRGLLVE